MNIPDRIYIQIEDDWGEFNFLSGYTHSADRINDSDIVYIREGSMNTLQQATHSQIRQLIYEAIDAEREYQLIKYPHPHSIGAYFTIIRKELREAEDSWTDDDDLGATQQEVIQVAAVAIACLEQINKDMNRQYSTTGEGG